MMCTLNLWFSVTHAKPSEIYELHKLNIIKVAFEESIKIKIII